MKDSLSYDFFVIPEKASETSIVLTEKENLIIESQKFIAFVRDIYLVGLSIKSWIVKRKMTPKCTLGDENE